MHPDVLTWSSNTQVWKFFLKYTCIGCISMNYYTSGDTGVAFLGFFPMWSNRLVDKKSEYYKILLAFQVVVHKFILY